MNKFMGGLTLGIIATACFFIFVDPFQRKAHAVQPGTNEITIDTSAGFPTPLTVDTILPIQLPAIPYQPNKTGIHRDSLVSFALSLMGTPYLYGSTDPLKGFDCSGFITFVFNHFKMAVPRSSYDFAKIGAQRSLDSCRPGDLILFTGTDPLERTIGHIGIICDTTKSNPSFIHSSSGKANGVTITSMDNPFYQDRFIAVTDILH